MQGWFNTLKSINVFHKKTKEKSYDHFNRCRKAFDKIQNSFRINTPNNLDIEELNLSTKGFVLQTLP
jgi:hypothetical protein